jgi:hypothetical protein
MLGFERGCRTAAAHIEKKATRPGMVSISRFVYNALPQRTASIFRFGGIFEEKDFFSTNRMLDSLLCEEVPEDQQAFA